MIDSKNISSEFSVIWDTKTHVSHHISQNIHNILSQSNYIVLWNGEIWEKAQELLKNKLTLESVGFEVPKTLVLAHDFLEKLFDLDFSHTNEIDKRTEIDTAEINDIYFEQLWKSLEYFSHETPLVIRSSWENDAQGIWIYKSDFCVFTKEWLIESLKTVLKSYFSPSAFAFRKTQNSSSKYDYYSCLNTFIYNENKELNHFTFWIIIQNIVGTKIENSYTTPLSWIALTSTPHDPEWYFLIDTWLCGAVNGGWYKLTYKESEEMDFDFWEFLYKNADKANEYNVFHQESKWLVYDAELQTFSSNILDAYINIDLEKYFHALKKLEVHLWTPTYLEFAYNQESEKFVVLQIASIIPSNNQNGEWKLQWEKIIEAGNVIWNGEKIVNHIFCLGENNYETLKDFNTTHKNYILIVPGFFSTIHKEFLQNNFDFYSNATAIIHTFHYQQYGGAISHYSWQIKAAWKMFGVTNIETKDLYKNLWSQDIISWKFHIICDEKKNQLLIGKI